MADIYYICRDCGKVFSESEMNHHSDMETSYSYGPKTYDVGYNCCPGCGSDDLSIAHKCVMCDGYHAEDDMIEGDRGYYCQDCVDESLSIKNVERYDEKILEYDDTAGAMGINPTIVDLLGGSRKVNMILCRVAEDSNFGMEDIRKTLDINLESFMDVISDDQNK